MSCGDESSRVAVGQNGPMPNRSPKLDLIAQSASPSEAAAIVAAVQRFMRDTAPPAAPAGAGPDPWIRAAMLEGVAREDPGETFDPWINA